MAVLEDEDLSVDLVEAVNENDGEVTIIEGTTKVIIGTVDDAKVAQDEGMEQIWVYIVVGSIGLFCMIIVCIILMVHNRKKSTAPPSNAKKVTDSEVVGQEIMEQMYQNVNNDQRETAVEDDDSEQLYQNEDNDRTDTQFI